MRYAPLPAPDYPVSRMASSDHNGGAVISASGRKRTIALAQAGQLTPTIHRCWARRPSPMRYRSMLLFSAGADVLFWWKADLTEASRRTLKAIPPETRHRSPQLTRRRWDYRHDRVAEAQSGAMAWCRFRVRTRANRQTSPHQPAPSNSLPDITAQRNVSNWAIADRPLLAAASQTRGRPEMVIRRQGGFAARSSRKLSLRFASRPVACGDGDARKLPRRLDRTTPPSKYLSHRRFRWCARCYPGRRLAVVRKSAARRHDIRLWRTSVHHRISDSRVPAAYVPVPSVRTRLFDRVQRVSDRSHRSGCLRPLRSSRGHVTAAFGVLARMALCPKMGAFRHVS